MSMVMDHKYDEWIQRYPFQITPVVTHPVVPLPALPTQQEIDEFRRLLDRAREYDKKNNEPNCEMEEKRNKLKKLAEELGIEIEFV
jgi:hypothetical protein